MNEVALIPSVITNSIYYLIWIYKAISHLKHPPLSVIYIRRLVPKRNLILQNFNLFNLYTQDKEIDVLNKIYNTAFIVLLPLANWRNAQKDTELKWLFCLALRFCRSRRLLLGYFEIVVTTSRTLEIMHCSGWRHLYRRFRSHIYSQLQPRLSIVNVR